MLAVFFCLFQKRIPDGAGGHSHRACNNRNILCPGPHISLLERKGGVAFFRGYEGSSHLNTVCPQGQHVADLGGVHDAAGHNDGDGDTVFFPIAFRTGDDFSDLLIVVFVKAVFCDMRKSLPGEAQMTSCMGTFNHEKIGGAVIMPVPHFQNDTGGFFRRDNGSDLRVGSFHICRKIHRKPGTGNDHVGTGLCRGACIRFIISGGNHDVVAKKSRAAAVRSLCQHSRLLKFRNHGAQVRFSGIFGKIRLPETDLSGGDYTDTAFSGHRSGKPGKAHPYSHSSLNQGKRRCLVSNT